MEQLKQAATLLYAVLGDMDEIPVEGLDNQKAFLGCADGIRTAAQVILQYVDAEDKRAAEKESNPEGEDVNGR
jgi:hypothetical protein